jgi:DNA polymerase III psi subunit
METGPNEAVLNSLFNHEFYWCEENENHSDLTVLEKAEPAAKTVEDSRVPIKYLGKNNKSILMIFKGESMSQWPKALKHTFLKILQSINLEFNDIACLTLSEIDQYNCVDLQAQIEFRYLFLWGVEPNLLKLESEIFTPSKQDGFELVFIPSLIQITEDPSLKRKLWDCIQSLSFD